MDDQQAADDIAVSQEAEAKASEPTEDGAVEDYPQILIIVRPDGYETHVDYRLSPPTVAGAAWLLERMAGMSLINTLQQQQQQANQSPAIIPFQGMPQDHLRKKGRN